MGVAVTGNTGCYGDRVNSRITLPVDLSEGVGKVQEIYEDTDLSGFQNNVLSLVENDKKVLVIVYASSKAMNIIKIKLPWNNFIIHRCDEPNEEEACEWIS